MFTITTHYSPLVLESSLRQMRELDRMPLEWLVLGVVSGRRYRVSWQKVTRYRYGAEKCWWLQARLDGRLYFMEVVRVNKESAELAIGLRMLLGELTRLEAAELNWTEIDAELVDRRQPSPDRLPRLAGASSP